MTTKKVLDTINRRMVELEERKHPYKNPKLAELKRLKKKFKENQS